MTRRFASEPSDSSRITAEIVERHARTSGNSPDSLDAASAVVGTLVLDDLVDHRGYQVAALRGSIRRPERDALDARISQCHDRAIRDSK